MSLSRLLVTLVALFLAGCGAGTPTGPSSGTGPLSGAWTGTLNSSGAPQAVQLELSDVPFGSAWVVTGRYTTRDAAGTVTGTGTVGASVTNSDVSMRLTPAQSPPCASTAIYPSGTVVLTLTVRDRQLSGDGLLVRCGDDVLVTASFSK